MTVTVRQGDQSWTAASEEEFEQLPERVVLWLFETMNEFLPFEEEHEFGDDWGEEEWMDEDFPSDFGPHAGNRRSFDSDFDDEHEDDGEDYYERRLSELESKIDQILGRLPAQK